MLLLPPPPLTPPELWVLVMECIIDDELVTGRSSPVSSPLDERKTERRLLAEDEGGTGEWGGDEEVDVNCESPK